MSEYGWEKMWGGRGGRNEEEWGEWKRDMWRGRRRKGETSVHSQITDGEREGQAAQGKKETGKGWPVNEHKERERGGWEGKKVS